MFKREKKLNIFIFEQTKKINIETRISMWREGEGQ